MSVRVCVYMCTPIHFGVWLHANAAEAIRISLCKISCRANVINALCDTPRF